MTIRYCWLGHSGVCVDATKPTVADGADGMCPGDIIGSITTVSFPLTMFEHIFGFIPGPKEVEEVTIMTGKYEKRGYEFL